ncbi:MAG: DUF4258 domain-containing protein [SAR324 cluster bacterium]|nr:DUF4258 domain-containing protein [SAR324 cluster bacterium]
MMIVWGGKLEGNGKRHSQNRSERRNITKDMVIMTLDKPDRTEIQSIDCKRYYKTFSNEEVCIVAVNQSNDEYSVITCFKVAK